MKSPRSVALLPVVGALALGAVAGCSGSGSTGPETTAAAGGSAATPVTITVSMDAGLKDDAIRAIDDRISQFEEKYPNITVTKQEFTWDATTFTAQLAGGTLPDVFTVPFTDGRGLVEQKQVADISQLVATYPWAAQLNPKVAEVGQATDGGQWAVPIAAYGQGLHYNRALFAQAGLDPDKPPTTWDEVRADAKTIAEETGQAGYAMMTQSNTGGWILASTVYAMGGRLVELDSDGEPVVTVDSDATKNALQYLQTLRWTDNAMGANFLYDWASIHQDFGAGKIGMFISGGGDYGNLITQNGLNPEDYGVTVVPLDGSDAGTLGGGTLAVVNAKATPEEQDAAVKWIDFYYIAKLTDQDQAVVDAQTTAAQNLPVGAPQLPVFDQATYDEQQGWIRDYANVPLNQFAPYTSQIFDQPLLPEPAVATQDVYAALDPVVQAVLTQKDADIDQLLSDAQAQVESIVS
jgi:multiple sugar transport system substrate-binding protein